MSVTEDGKPVPFRYTVALDYATSLVSYLGLALPGSNKALDQWQIRKFTYDGSGNVTDIQFANGSVAFNQIWDNRAALSYS